MSTDYRRKALKPLILKHIPYVEDSQRHIVKELFEQIDKGEMFYALGDTFIVMGQSPKSQKKIRIAR